MTATMNISMPDSLKAFVDERVRSGGYGSHSEYLRELVRRDEQQAATERLRALIAEGLNSPQGRDWRDIKTDLLQRATAQG